MNQEDISFRDNPVQTVLLALLSTVFYLSENKVLSTTLFIVFSGLILSAFIDITQKARHQNKPAGKLFTPQIIITLAAQLFILGMLFLLVWYFLSRKIQVI